MWPEWRSRYSDILRVVRSRVRTPVETGHEANPSILYNGHRLSCLEVQRSERGVEHPPHLAPECGYCDTSAGHHASIRHVTGQTSPFSIWLSVSWTKRNSGWCFSVIYGKTEWSPWQHSDAACCVLNSWILLRFYSLFNNAYQLQQKFQNIVNEILIKFDTLQIGDCKWIQMLSELYDLIHC